MRIVYGTFDPIELRTETKRCSAVISQGKTLSSSSTALTAGHPSEATVTASVTGGKARMNDSPDTPPAVGIDYDARYLVINGTNDPLTRVSCIHASYDMPRTNEASAVALGSGESIAVQTLHGVVLRPDFWQVAFIRNGIMYVNITVAEGDVTRASEGCLCVVALFEDQFIVLPPRSWPTFFGYDLPRWPVANAVAIPSHSPHDVTCEASGQKKVYGAGVNDDIKGSFVIINATNGRINDVAVVHMCNGKADTFNLPIMQKDDISPIKGMNSATWHEDLWSVSFKLADGQTRSRQDKRCDYERSDSPQVCLIILYSDDFSIVDPVSDGCYFNHY